MFMPQRIKCDGTRYHGAYGKFTEDPNGEQWIEADIAESGAITLRRIRIAPTHGAKHFCDLDCLRLWLSETLFPPEPEVDAVPMPEVPSAN